VVAGTSVGDAGAASSSEEPPHAASTRAMVEMAATRRAEVCMVAPDHTAVNQA
jgi:hypothetical protein